MNDKAFLFWLRARLITMGENPRVDYMLKLRAIAEITPEESDTKVVLTLNHLTPVKVPKATDE